MRTRLFLFASALAALATAGPAFGGGPQSRRIADHETFAKGTLENLSLDEEGVLRPGPVFEATALDADTAWAALAQGDVLWLGIGNEARVVRVDAAGATKRWELGDGLMVTALAPLEGDAIAAAVFPGGRIYKVTAAGEVSLHATLPVEHVWALQADGRGALVAACGVPGSLYGVDAFGAPAKIADVDDEHARCLAPAAGADADYFVGTSPKGRVLAAKAGKLRVVRDLEEKEVVGLVSLGDAGLLIAANADQAGGNAQAMANMLRRIAEPNTTDAGEKAPPRDALQDGSIFHLEPGGVLTTLWASKKVALLGLARAGKGAVAGTYPSGRVVRVAPGAPSALIADLPEAEASVVLGGEDLRAVVTSNPAVLHRRKAGVAAGSWTSAPIDGEGPSRWGRVTLWGRGVGTLEFRHGETEEPDDAWSAWKPVAGFDGQAGGVDASGRFLQLRAGLKGADASLRAVEIVARTPNRAPAIRSLEVQKPGSKEGAPPKANARREISWKVEDADGDTLRVTLEANRKGSPHWAKLVDGKVLPKPKWTWDTTGIPDGVYRLRLRLDDGPSNEPDRARGATRTYTGLRVDNTAPTAKVKARRFSGGRLQIEGTAEDANGGRIYEVRVSVDGGDWIPLAAKDGLYDESKEAFFSTVRAPTEGAHDVVVQVTDGDGNIGSAATVVR